MFGSTKRPGMRGTNSMTLGSIVSMPRGGDRVLGLSGIIRGGRSMGSLSGTVFTEAASLGSDSREIYWVLIKDGTYAGSGGGTYDDQTISSIPKGAITFQTSEEQAAYIKKIASGGSGVVEAAAKLLGLTPAPPLTPKPAPTGMSTKTKIAIGVAAAGALYLLFKK